MQSSLKHKTAILVFANSSKEEVKNKTIVKGNELFDALTAHTLKTVEKSGLPYFHFSEEQQIGHSFGERFTNAIEAVFNKGYDTIITIGNDTPQLKPSDLLETEKQLKSEKFVLGPTIDGGFYLMGLQKNQFDASVFKTFAWQTSGLSKQLLQWVAENVQKTFFLQTLVDIDTVEDIKSILAYASSLPKVLLSTFLKIIAFNKNIRSETIVLYQNLTLQTYHNKGSPLLLQL